jgi:large subunit ribosomal protein L17
MRHGKKVNHLGRTSSHRKAMLSNMAASLILHKRINTTLAKAKALRGYVEPLITRSKDDSTHSRRMVFSYLQNKEAVIALFKEVSVKVASRPGGYTRILKTGNRLGDNAEMCMMELVDFNENMLAAKAAPKAKTTRRGRGTKDKVTDTKTAKPVAKAPVAPAAEEVVKVDETPEVPETPKVEDVTEEPTGETTENKE